MNIFFATIIKMEGESFKSGVFLLRQMKIIQGTIAIDIQNYEVKILNFYLLRFLRKLYIKLHFLDIPIQTDDIHILGTCLFMLKQILI